MKAINEMTDQDIHLNAIIFALKKTSIKRGQDPNIKRPDFHETKRNFIESVKWLRDNFKQHTENSLSLTEATL